MADAGRMELPNGCQVVPAHVGLLVPAAQCRLVEGLEADEQPAAPAARRQIEQLVIVGDANAALAEPALPERDHRREELLRVLTVADEAVIHEYDVPTERRELVDHLAHGTGPETVLVERCDGAEPASVGAATCRFDEAHRSVGPLVQKRPVRPGQSRQVARLAAVDLPEPTGRDVLHHPRNRALGVTDAHGIGMRYGLVRHERRVIAPQDHRLPLAAKTVGDLVSVRGIVGHERDTDDIRVGCEIDRLKVLVDDPRFHVRRHRSGNIEAREHREPEVAGAAGSFSGSDPPFRRCRVDQRELDALHVRTPR